jgi:hypothetical protein
MPSKKREKELNAIYLNQTIFREKIAAKLYKQ